MRALWDGPRFPRFAENGRGHGDEIIFNDDSREKGTVVLVKTLDMPGAMEMILFFTLLLMVLYAKNFLHFQGGKRFYVV
jgi:hypothetical protein